MGAVKRVIAVMRKRKNEESAALKVEKGANLESLELHDHPSDDS